MINFNHKIIFIGNPRSCTTSLNKLLKPRGFDFSYWHDPVQYYIDNIPNYKDYQYFMICRNPYDRFVSWWFQHRRHNHKFIMKYESFEEWILSGEYHDFPTRTEGDPRPPRNYWIQNSPLIQTHFIKNDKNINVNILRFEKIQEDWENVFLKTTNLSFDSTLFPKTNDTIHNHFEEYYDQRLKDIVFNYSREDFKYFGYEE